MNRRVLFLAACLLLWTSVLEAQERPSFRLEVERGARLRLTTADQRVTGQVVASEDGRMIVLRQRDTDIRISLAEVQVAEVRGGRDRMRGALWGGAILAAVTTTGAAVDMARGEVGFAEVISGFAGGALIGAGIGALVAPVGWVRIPVGSSLQVVSPR